jgi:hypothetical protein
MRSASESQPESPPDEQKSQAMTEFEAESRRTGQSPLWQELLQYLQETGKWWLLPILICCTILSLIAWAAGTAAAPFIYTLF